MVPARPFEELELVMYIVLVICIPAAPTATVLEPITDLDGTTDPAYSVPPVVVISIIVETIAGATATAAAPLITATKSLLIDIIIDLVQESKQLLQI